MKTIMELANEIFAMNGELKNLLENGEKLRDEEVKKKVDFEGYLQDKFVEENPQVLDDDISDSFNDWLGGSEIQDIIDYGQRYAEKVYRGKVK